MTESGRVRAAGLDVHKHVMTIRSVIGLAAQYGLDASSARGETP
ncbi:MAG: hypothetical protein ABSA02_16475 [Trebonia sp.]|jgi:hypothetical protein